MSRSTRGTHRQALLKAAQTLLRDRGRASITARDLVAASKTNLGSIGYHFGSKDALLDEAARLAFEEWAEAVADIAGADRDVSPAKRLATSLQLILDDFGAIQPYFLAFIETVARSVRSPEIRDQLAAHYQKQRTRVARMITDSLGETLDPGESDHLASLLMAISDGLMLQSLIDARSMPSSRRLADASRKAFTVALGQASTDAEPESAEIEQASADAEPASADIEPASR